ncbi:MAG: 1-acyl-sn-glycerol-3-phosphate acyltransferase [Thermomicrobiales bacterium]
MPWRFLHGASKVVVRRRLELEVDGLHHLPAHGPVLIAARHFHHLYDGCALLATVPRPLHILVALDWVTNPAGRIVMERACHAARWPVVERPSGPGGVVTKHAAVVFRHAACASLDLWRAGRMLLVFPEGYPNIDPGFTPKRDETEFLPFQRGYIRLVALAAQEGMQVPIVPTGLSYQRGEKWRVHLRFGAPIFIEKGRSQEEAAAQAIETEVRLLSAPLA